MKQIKEAQRIKMAVKVGLPAGSAPYPDGTSVIEVGAIHEFGEPTRGIPERSWLRANLQAHMDEYREFAARLAAKVARSEISMGEALDLLGTKVASDTRNTLNELSEPPNSKETIRRKGTANPLVDTGHLKGQITHQVVRDD